MQPTWSCCVILIYFCILFVYTFKVFFHLCLWDIILQVFFLAISFLTVDIRVLLASKISCKVVFLFYFVKSLYNDGMGSFFFFFFLWMFTKQPKSDTLSPPVPALSTEDWRLGWVSIDQRELRAWQVACSYPWSSCLRTKGGPEPSHPFPIRWGKLAFEYPRKRWWQQQQHERSLYG